MAYNKVKAHEYYMKHRKLKGKKSKGNVMGSNFGTRSGPSVTSIGGTKSVSMSSVKPGGFASVSSLVSKPVSVSSIGTKKKKPKSQNRKASSKKKKK